MKCKHCGENIGILKGEKKEEFPNHNWVHSKNNVIFCCNTVLVDSYKFEEEAAEPSKEYNIKAILKQIDDL